MKKDIEITKNMNLGQYSPAEITELNENKRKSKTIKESQLRKIIRESILEMINNKNK